MGSGGSSPQPQQTAKAAVATQEKYAAGSKPNAAPKPAPRKNEQKGSSAVDNVDVVRKKAPPPVPPAPAQQRETLNGHTLPAQETPKDPTPKAPPAKAGGGGVSPPTHTTAAGKASVNGVSKLQAPAFPITETDLSPLVVKKEPNGALPVSKPPLGPNTPEQQQQQSHARELLGTPGTPAKVRAGGAGFVSRIQRSPQSSRSSARSTEECLNSSQGTRDVLDSFSLTRGLTPPQACTPGKVKETSLKKKAFTPPCGSTTTGEYWDKTMKEITSKQGAKGAGKKPKASTAVASLDDVLRNKLLKIKGDTGHHKTAQPQPQIIDLMTQHDGGDGGDVAYTEEDYSYAEWIGMDIEKHPHLMHIAREGLRANVPEPWVAVEKPTGDVAYYNQATKEHVDDHPLDEYYREKYAAAVEGEGYMSVEEYILSVLRPHGASSQPIVITNTYVQFTDVTTTYSIRMMASPEGLRYTVDGAERPVVKKVAYDPKTKMLRFPDIKKGATLPKECPDKLVAAMKRLCDMSGASHNFPAHLSFTPAPQDRARERPGGTANPCSPMHPTERRLRKTRRRGDGGASPFGSPLGSPLLSPGMETLQPMQSTSSSGGGVGLSSGGSGVAAADDELFEECMRRVEENGIARGELLQHNNFSDKEIDELLKELKFTVMQRYKLKARVDLLRMERLADMKNAELDRQQVEVEAQMRALEEEEGQEEEEMLAVCQEAEENEEILERLGAENVPEEYICTITGEIMCDPVCTSDGHVYERQAVAAWLCSHDTSPNTGSVLENKSLIPNLAIKKALHAWRETVLPKPDG